MKYISWFGIFTLVTLLACGQVKKDSTQIASADSTQINAYKQKSIFYQNKAPDSAVYFASEGLKLCRAIHAMPGETVMLLRLADINEQYGNFSLAEKYQQDARAVFDTLHDIPGYTAAGAQIGLLEGRQGNFIKGIKLTGDALKACKQRNDSAGMIQAYTKLAEIYEISGNTGKALQNYYLAEQLANGMPLSDVYIDLINRMGKLHAKLGNTREAANYYEKGIGKTSSQSETGAYITLLNDAGKTWDTLGNKKKALAYHQLGLQKARASGLPEEEVRSLMGLAGTLKNEDANLSITHLQNALLIADSIGHKQLSSEIYLSLSDIYKQQERYAEALTALEAHHRLLDSLTNVNKGHKIAVLQSSYELEASRLHVETLKLSNQQKTYQRNVGIFIAIAILVLLLVLAGYFYKTNRLNKQLEASNLIKDKLFSIIGHDLRSPVGGITQLLEIIEDEHELTGEERQRMIAEMRKQADVTLGILNALLSWGEAQLKGININVSDFDPKNYIIQNIEALHTQAHAKSIVVNDLIPPGIILSGDANHFDFIIRNLVSNAIKFSHPSGTIEIASGVETGSGKIIFSVTDHGKGISKTQQELFLKSTLDVSYGTKGEKGTGIGLMLSKEFVIANHGSIWIKSEVGNGTAFYFSFPSKIPG